MKIELLLVLSFFPMDQHFALRTLLLASTGVITSTLIPLVSLSGTILILTFPKFSIERLYKGQTPTKLFCKDRTPYTCWFDHLHDLWPSSCQQATSWTTPSISVYWGEVWGACFFLLLFELNTHFKCTCDGAYNCLLPWLGYIYIYIYVRWAMNITNTGSKYIYTSV